MQVEIPQSEINGASFDKHDWDNLLRKYGVDPHASYKMFRKCEGNFNGVVVTQ